MDGEHVRHDFDVGCESLDHLFGHGGSSHATDGFAGRGSSTSLPVPDAVFGLVGEVGVGWTESGLHFPVGLWPGVFIEDGDADRGSEGEALEGA